MNMKMSFVGVFWLGAVGEQKRLRVCAVLAAGLWFSCAIEAGAVSTPQPTLSLDMTETYGVPLTGIFPIFHRTALGQLALIWGGNGDYHMISDDQGRTWHHWEEFSNWPEMSYLDVVRRGSELLAFGFNGSEGSSVWWSSDEGATWGGHNQFTPQDKPTGILNQRILVTSSSNAHPNRVIVPIDRLLGAEGPDPDNVGTMYSDDAGRSWQQSPIFGPPAGYPIKPEGIGEPAVVELANGKTWMVARGLGGHLLQAFSDDGGATWGEPGSEASPTTLVSPISAVNAKRIPGSDAVIVFWNNCQPGTSTNWNDYPNVWLPRTPLVFAVSRDNCQTWSEPVVIDSGTAAYPSICFSDTEMFVTYWEDPNGGIGMSANSHIKLVAYDIQSLTSLPEPSAVVLLSMALLGLLAYAWRKRR
jgi:hypothetical protein